MMWCGSHDSRRDSRLKAGAASLAHRPHGRGAHGTKNDRAEHSLKPTIPSHPSKGYSYNASLVVGR